MTEDGTDALEQALALYQTPGRLPLLLNRPLPRAVLLLIRIAAGDAEAIASASERTAETRRVVVDAAVLYVQQILFHEAADSYRLLGVDADADRDAVKEHYRWLMRWLHPDRHPERWEVVYSERVNRAWASLNSEQRRLDYDAQLQQRTSEGAVNASVSRSLRVRHKASDVLVPQPMLSPRTVRMLPVLVLGGLALVSIIGLVAFFRTQGDPRVADRVGSRKIAVQVGDSSAQEEVIRRRIAFEEHVIELSQPILPTSPSETDRVVPSDAAAPLPGPAALPAPSVGALANAGSEIAEAAPQATASTHASTPPAAVPPVGRFVASKTDSAPDLENNPPIVGPASRPGSTVGMPGSQGKAGSAKAGQSLASTTSPGVSGSIRSSVAPPEAPLRASVRPPQQTANTVSLPTPLATRQVQEHSQQNVAVAVSPAIAEPTSASVAPRSMPVPVVAAAPLAQTVAVAAVLPSASHPSVVGSAHSQFAAHVSSAAAASDAPTGGMSSQLASTVVPRKFEDAYSKGDLEQLMLLFTPNAIENNRGIVTIRQGYGHLFHDSAVHELRLDELHWVLRPDRIVGSGSFEARIRHNDEQIANQVRGWIQIEAVPMDGNWKIQRLLYRNAE